MGPFRLGSLLWLTPSLLLFALGGNAKAAGAKDVFRVGHAVCGITPAESMPMWGYAKFNRPDNMSAGVIHPLMAHAVVFEGGGKKAAVVSLDLGRAPDEASVDRIKTAVRENAGVETVMLIGSHTHHGPALELVRIEGKDQTSLEYTWTYYETLEQKLIALITEAAGKTAPAQWGWTSVETNQNRNRHTTEAPVPRDEELLLLRVDDMEGKPLALIVSFAGHPTNHIPQDNRYTPDFPHYLRARVRAELNAPVVFLQGAAGDMQCEMDDSQWGKENFDADVGERLAAEVLAALPQIETHPPAAPGIQAIEDTFEFGLRVDVGNEKFMRRVAFNFAEEFAVSYGRKYAGNRMRPRMTTLLLNNELAIVGASGEFFSDLANMLKQGVTGPEVIFAGYCNGHDLYFPTKRAYAQGGYGANAGSAWVEEGGPERMIAKALENIRALYQPGK